MYLYLYCPFLLLVAPCLMGGLLQRCLVGPSNSRRSLASCGFYLEGRRQGQGVPSDVAALLPSDTTVSSSYSLGDQYDPTNRVYIYIYIHIHPVLHCLLIAH